MFQLFKEKVSMEMLRKISFWGGMNILHAKEDSIGGMNLEGGSLLVWKYIKLIFKIHFFNI